MEAAISNRKWTRLFIFCITFTVIFFFSVLCYIYFKRQSLAWSNQSEKNGLVVSMYIVSEEIFGACLLQSIAGTICFELEKSGGINNHVDKTSLIFDKLWSIWIALILFCTSELSDYHKNKDEAKEQFENLCINSYISTETFKLILSTHLPQDIFKVLEAIDEYFNEIFENVISGKLLLTVHVCLVGSLLMLITNRTILPLLKKFRNIYYGSHIHRSHRCREDEIVDSRKVSPAFRTDSCNNNNRSQSYLSVSSLSKFFLLSFLLSLLWEFIRLYQRKMAEHASAIVKGIPAACDPHSMSIYDSMKEYLRHQFSWTHGLDACKDYYFALLVDPLWEVSPIMVISSVFTQGLLYPLELTCTSLGRGIRFFFLEIPAQWQPLILFVLLLISLVVLLMLCSYRLHIPLLLKLEPLTPLRNSSPGIRKLRNNLHDLIPQNMLSLVGKKCDSCNLSDVQYLSNFDKDVSNNGSYNSLENISHDGYRNNDIFQYSAKTEDKSSIDSFHQIPSLLIKKSKLNQKDTISDNSKPLPNLKHSKEKISKRKYVKNMKYETDLTYSP